MLDRRWSLQVRRHEVRLATLLLEPVRELRRGRRLARALESGEQDDRRWPRGVVDLERTGAEHLDELVVDGLDDLLARGQALAEGLAAQAFAHRVEEGAHHAELDVGLEQGFAHVAESVVEVGVTQASA